MPNINISDSDLANNILIQHKLEASSLTNLILESANNNLRGACMNILQDSFNHQKQVFDLMSSKGWYKTQVANPQDITNAQQSISQM